MDEPLSESDLLDRIYEGSADLGGLAGAFGEIVVGPGDDCAVIREPSKGGGLLLIGVDQLVEGRHFEIGTDIELIARKVVARAVSDIAAMGGRPCWALATGVLPDGFVLGGELFDAMARWARHWGCPLIGGDIALGPGPMCLTATVAGRMDDGAEPLLRSGACEGDELWLTGRIGGSFSSGRHLLFEPRIGAGLAASASARTHAAIDISDGLGKDAARIGRASGMRLEIKAGSLPITRCCSDWQNAVAEGEDYELLLACEPGHTTPAVTDPPLLGPIGVVRKCRKGESPGATIIDSLGTEHDAAELGWDHGSR